MLTRDVSILATNTVSSLNRYSTSSEVFYLQHNTFGGKIKGQSFGTCTTSRAWSAENIEVKLQAAKERLSGVFIENEPWQKCLKRYDRPHTFFYADPPYWQTSGYTEEFEWLQYEQLAEAMRTMQGKMMLSINDHLDIRSLFKDFRITELKLTYSISRKTEGRIPRSELVICNY